MEIIYVGAVLAPVALGVALRHAIARAWKRMRHAMTHVTCPKCGIEVPSTQYNEFWHECATCCAARERRWRERDFEDLVQKELEKERARREALARLEAERKPFR